MHPGNLSATMHSMIYVKRAYSKASPKDGYRVLIDRLWPRGISKDDLKLDAWLKDLSPSHELRKWFAHEASKWTEFQKRYAAELKGQEETLDDLRRRSRTGSVTLVFSSKEEVHNNAAALKRILER